MNETENLAVEPTPTRPTLGQWLTQMRQAQGLSAQDVASRTNRNVRQIMALEADDFSNLSSSILLRAIVRHYAKAIGIDEQEAIAHLPADYQAAAPAAPARDADVNKVFASSGTPVKTPWMSRTAMVVLALAVFGLLAYWIFGSRFNAKPEGGQKISEPNQVQVVAPPVAAPAAVPVVPVVDAAPATPLATSSTDLVLKFKGAKSWVEVKDADGKKVISGTFEAGAEQSGTGKLPLSLTIGNAAEVEMTWKGQPYDLKPAMGKSTTARITQLD
ncbi:MAG: helix-turn-helix domain-containing protein [Formosimonas sp.]